MKRPTTKEIVVRMLLEKGDWEYGYALQSKHTPWGFSGVDADTRAHELSREGFFDSPNNRYFIEHRKQGKYAQFRVSKVEPLESWTEKNRRGMEWFDLLASSSK